MLFLRLIVAFYFVMAHMAVTTMQRTVEMLPGVYVSASIVRPVTTFMLATLGAALVWLIQHEGNMLPSDPKIPVATVSPNSALRWWVQR